VEVSLVPTSVAEVRTKPVEISSTKTLRRQ
jgi:hypothetical protein